MSCYMLNDATLDYLAAAAVVYRARVDITPEEADALDLLCPRGYVDFAPGMEQLAKQILWDANRVSVQARYPHYPEMWSDDLAPFRGVATLDPRDPPVVLKQLRCFEYQSCEADTWASSLGLRLSRAIAWATCSHVQGVEEAPWGLSGPILLHVMLTRRPPRSGAVALTLTFSSESWDTYQDFMSSMARDQAGIPGTMGYTLQIGPVEGDDAAPFDATLVNVGRDQDGEATLTIERHNGSNGEPAETISPWDRAIHVY